MLCGWDNTCLLSGKLVNVHVRTMRIITGATERSNINSD